MKQKKNLKLLPLPRASLFFMSLVFVVVLMVSTIAFANLSDTDQQIVDDVCRVDPDDNNQPASSAAGRECSDILEDYFRQCYNFAGSPEDEVANLESCRSNARDNGRRIVNDRITTSSQPRDFDAGDTGGDCTGSLDPDDCGITAYIRIFTDALTVLVGVVVVMMLVIGGIQYSSAGSNPQAVAAAKKRISQALFALFIYIFMAAFLQWLVPGGVF